MDNHITEKETDDILKACKQLIDSRAIGVNVDLWLIPLYVIPCILFIIEKKPSSFEQRSLDAVWSIIGLYILFKVVYPKIKEIWSREILSYLKEVNSVETFYSDVYDMYYVKNKYNTENTKKHLHKDNEMILRTCILNNFRIADEYIEENALVNFITALFMSLFMLYQMYSVYGSSLNNYAILIYFGFAILFNILFILVEQLVRKYKRKKD